MSVRSEVEERQQIEVEEESLIEAVRQATTLSALAVEVLSVPKGTVVLMWTRAAHGVNPGREGS